ncbi:hypothetical protein LNTAR_15787 [Lentisphaera araneosa HTCC2155]|uniref:Uncharacterized protein n=1 Tax=Lentisphaera araneosa HTCC2155 TaxID=313628 RepID=A6DMF5_9BACT|nr:hypothetical protein [Lentisphaera araneosa]EDM27145.1 hypothetical protein LNTAR_15787 [Lentisphaera araneosa HTCC2155]
MFKLLALLSIAVSLCSSCKSKPELYAKTLKDIPERAYIYALGKKGAPEALSCKLACFSHPETGKSVSVLGMVHMADASFYDQVHHIGLDHDLSLTEGVHGRPSLSPHNFIVQYISSYFSRINYYNDLVPQNLHLQDGGNELNADMSLKELSKESSLFTSFMQLLSLPIIIVGGEINNLALYTKYQLSGAGLMESLKLSELSRNRKLLFGHMRKVDDKDHAILPGILSSRNQKLFNLLEAELKKDTIQSILVPWGAAHSPEIENELISKGFVKNSPDQWLKAINFHPTKTQNTNQFYIPLIAYLYNDQTSTEYSFLLATIKGVEKKNFSSTSLLWSLLMNKSSSDKHYYISVLPRVFDRPVFFDYSKTGSQKQFRALFFINYEWQ